MRISRSSVVVATLVTGGLLLISGAQPWVVLALSSAETSARELIVNGATLAPSFVGLSLAYVAAMIVGLVSRPVVRVVSSTIGVVAVMGALFVSWLVITDPVEAARATIARVTGVSDTVRQRELIDAFALEPWAYVALILLIASVGVGGVVIVAGRFWTSNSRRYERPEKSADPGGRRDPREAGDPHATWDTFSGGGDPTRSPSH
jgi:uncharacterized membrane protein (TIGR02234 family)